MEQIPMVRMEIEGWRQALSAAIDEHLMDISGTVKEMVKSEVTEFRLKELIAQNMGPILESRVKRAIESAIQQAVWQNEGLYKLVSKAAGEALLKQAEPKKGANP